MKLLNKFKFITLLLFCHLLFYPVLAWASPTGARPPERIVSLKPNITEILFELGLGDEIVGVTRFCDVPKATTPKEIVADYVRVNVEKVLWLKPSWVIGSDENADAKEIYFIQNRGIKTQLYNFKRIADLKKSITSLGDLFNRSFEARLMIQQIETDLKKLKDQLRDEDRQKKLVIIVGRNPLMVVGGDNFIDDALTEIGLSHVAHKSQLRYPSYSLEKFVSAKPEVIFDLAAAMAGGDKKSSLEWYQQFKSLPAVKDGRVYFLDADNFRPAPRFVRGLQELVGDLQEK